MTYHKNRTRYPSSHSTLTLPNHTSKEDTCYHCTHLSPYQHYISCVYVCVCSSCTWRLRNGTLPGARHWLVQCKWANEVSEAGQFEKHPYILFPCHCVNCWCEHTQLVFKTNAKEATSNGLPLWRRCCPLSLTNPISHLLIHSAHTPHDNLIRRH